MAVEDQNIIGTVTKDVPSGSGLSASVVVERGPERTRVSLATFAVLVGSASYIIMMFIAMPLAVHLIVNVSNGCSVETDATCFAPTNASQKTLTLTLTLLRAMTFSFGSFLGTVSDKFGRKPMLVGALAGYAVTGLLLMIGWETQSIALIMVGSMILGASSPINPHGLAYVSDISAPERLATNLGLLQGVGYFLGLMLGAMVSLAIAASTTGADRIQGESVLVPYNKMFNVSFGAGLGFSGISAVLLMLFLPESLHTTDRKKKIELVKANPLGFLTMVSRNSYTFFVWLSMFIAYISVGAGEAVAAGWWLRRYLQTEIAKFVTYIVVLWTISGFGSVIMTKVYTGIKGLKFACHVSMILTIVFGIAFSTAPTIGASYMAAGLSFFGASSVPTLLAVVMGQVDSSEKGSMAGALRSSEAVGKLIGIVVFGGLFAEHIKPFTPDASCIPDDYGPENKINTCECGVGSCPIIDPVTTSYRPNTCSLGQLTPSFFGSESTTEMENLAPYPNALITAGIVTRPETCVDGGGSPGGFKTDISRVWCASEAAVDATTNSILGCPKFDFFKSMASNLCEKALNEQSNDTSSCMAAYGDLRCPVYPTSAGCDGAVPEDTVYDNSTYHNNTFQRVMANDPDPCPDVPDVTLNLCAAGPIASFPGLFPFLYQVVLPAISYLCFVIAELFLSAQDKKFWRRDPTTVVPTTDN